MESMRLFMLIINSLLDTHIKWDFSTDTCTVTTTSIVKVNQSRVVVDYVKNIKTNFDGQNSSNSKHTLNKKKTEIVLASLEMHRSQNAVVPRASSIQPFALPLEFWAQSFQTVLSSDHPPRKFHGHISTSTLAKKRKRLGWFILADLSSTESPF